MIYDWISLDRTTPNRLRCARCGTIRSMDPEDGALKTDLEASDFVRAHKGCKEVRGEVRRVEGTKR